jgi:hypothetical protein
MVPRELFFELLLEQELANVLAPTPCQILRGGYIGVQRHQRRELRGLSEWVQFKEPMGPASYKDEIAKVGGQNRCDAHKAGFVEVSRH